MKQIPAQGTPVFDFSCFPRLETARLILREIGPQDKPALAALLTDPEVTRYLDVDVLSFAGDVLAFHRALYERQEGLRWGIALRDDEDTLIGTCGYSCWDRRIRCAEIGCDLTRSFWGQGIITEAVAAAIRFGFERMGLNRIEADTRVGNDAAARVLQKLGFHEEGILRQKGFWQGTFHDLRFFSLLYSEWSAIMNVR